MINRLLAPVRLIQTQSELLKELCKLSHTFGVIQFHRPKGFPALSFFFIYICWVVNVLRCKKGGNDCTCYSKEDHNENSPLKKQKRLLKRLTLFDRLTVNPQKLSNQSAGGGQLPPESDQRAPSHYSQRRPVFHKNKSKGFFFLTLEIDRREINSSKRQLRPMSTREELQAEQVAQITWQLESGGLGGGGGHTLEGCWLGESGGWGACGLDWMCSTRP